MTKSKVFYFEFILILSLFFISNLQNKPRSDYFDLMIEARDNRIELGKIIYEEKLKRNIFMDKKIDKSGLIGEEFTGITTTMGYLDSKLLSVNPDFAAYIVKKLKEANLKKGDIVLVNMSSSFPGLNLSVISALDTLELDGVIVNSIGASMYGANNEEFIFLEMEKVLAEKGMIKNRIRAYSMGGDNDLGDNFDTHVKNKINDRLKKLNIVKFSQENFKDNFRERVEFYNNFGKPKYFINVGGNLLFEKLEKYYSDRNISVMSLLNIKQLGVTEEITIKMAKNPEELKLYQKEGNKILDILILIIFFISLIFLFRVKKIKRSEKNDWTKNI